MRNTALLIATCLVLSGSIINPARADLLNEVEHGYADNNGVKIHYATVGKGPLVVMIHGFPDFWYTWRAQMPASHAGIP